VVRIFNVDLDAIYQRDALFVGLHCLGSELGFWGDERDSAFIELAGIGVCAYGDLLLPESSNLPAGAALLCSRR